MIKLDLGGINKRRGKDGWWSVNCGATDEWCDYNLDIVSPEFDAAFADGSVDTMFCSHTIEHLPCNKTVPALQMWRRKLKTGGWLEIICPDGLDIVMRFANGEVPWLTVMNVLYGVPEWLADNPYNQHVYAFSFDTLKDITESCGFRFHERKERSWQHNYANEKNMPYFGKFWIKDLHVVFVAV